MGEPRSANPWTAHAAMPAASPSHTRAGLAFGALQGIAVLAFLCQAAIDPRSANLLSAALILGASTVTLQYLRRTRAFAEVPVSSFALLGMCVTTQWGALAAQSAAWTALGENLRDPVHTFAWLGLFQLVAVAALALLRKLHLTMALRDSLAANVMRPLGVFEIPSAGNLWVLGMVGMLAQFLSATGPAEANSGDRFLAGFTFLAWAPYIVPLLHQRYGAAYCDLRRQWIGLGLYLLLAVAMSMALNYRYIMFAGITTALLLWLMMLLGDERPTRLPKLWKVIAFIVLGTLAVKVAADFATAMAIARAGRGSASAVALMEETLHTLLDPNAVQLYRQWEEDQTRSALYDEHYILNPALARFVETKFHDNTFFLIQDLRPLEIKELWRLTADSLWAILPRPVLGFIGVSVEKTGEFASIGDFIYHFKYGGEIGGFKTASIFGQGLALMPLAFPAVYLLLCLVLFLAWEIQSRRLPDGRVEISTLAMLSAWKVFTGGIVSESIALTVSFPLRLVWQTTLLYVAVFLLSRLLFEPFRPAAAAAPGFAPRGEQAR